MPAYPKDPKQMAAAVREMIEDSKNRNAQVFDAITDELDFCFRLKQYLDDTGNVRDTRRVQPRDASIFRVIRYKGAQMLSSPLYLEPRPVDEGSDIDELDVAKGVIEHFVRDPFNLYDMHRADVVYGALAGRRWMMTADVDPTLENRIVLRTIDPRLAGWQPGYKSPHHPACGWFWEERYVDTACVHDLANEYGWSKQCKDVLPDGGPDGASKRAVSTVGAGGTTPGQSDSRLRRTTLWFWWGRYDQNTMQRYRPGSYTPLDPEHHHMACTSPTCGYQSATQGELGMQLPEVDEGDAGGGACPDCGSPLFKVKATVVEETVAVYPKGLRLVITAPNSKVDVPLYDGPWPAELRTFPVLCWDAYTNPAEEWGPSDVSLNYTIVLTKNATVRLYYEALQDARALMIVPNVGMYDEYGEPFQFTDDRGRFALYKGQAKPVIENIPGGQVGNGYANFYQLLDGALRGNEGTSDVSGSLSPERSKNIPVGTIDRLVQTGNVPIDDHLRSFQLQESLFLTALLDLIRGVQKKSTPYRFMGSDGVERIASFAGHEIPRADMWITTGPSQTYVDEKKSAQYKELLSIPPQYRRSYTVFMGLSPSILRAIERDEQDFAMEQQKLADEQAWGGGGGIGTESGAAPGEGAAVPGQANGATNPALMRALASRGMGTPPAGPPAGGGMDALRAMRESMMQGAGVN